MAGARKSRQRQARAGRGAWPITFAPKWVVSVWGWIQAAAEWTYNVLTRAIWVAVFVIVIAIVIRGLTQEATVIEQISVPKDLIDKGFTPEVIGRRLRDEMVKFARAQNSSKQNPDVALHGELPTIVVPTVGISLDAVVITLRSLLQVTRSRSITGELTIRQNLLWLNLRIDGRELYSSSAGVDREKPEELLVAAVPKVMEAVQPYFYALWFSHQEPDKSFQMIDRLIVDLKGNDENIAWLYSLQGNLHHQHSDDVAALRSYDEAVRHQPNSAAFHQNRGISLMSLSRTDEAIDAYRRALALKSNYALTHSNYAIALVRRGKWKEAVEEYDKAISNDRDNPSFPGNLGRALKEMRIEGEASSYFVMELAMAQRAVERDPQNALFHAALGQALIDNKKYDEAIAGYSRAIALEPKVSTHNLGLASALSEAGRADEAVAELRKVIAHSPKMSTAYFRIGAIRQRQGRLAEAELEYRNAINIKPKYREAYFNLSLIFERRENDSEAKDLCRKAIAADPGYARAHQRLGNLLSQEKPDEAIEHYRLALTADPHMSRRGLIDLLRELGREEEAVAQEQLTKQISADDELLRAKIKTMLGKTTGY